MFPLARGGSDPLHSGGAVRAVFSAVGTGAEQRSAYGALLRVQPVIQGCFQFLVQRHTGGCSPVRTSSGIFVPSGAGGSDFGGVIVIVKMIYVIYPS